MNIHLGGMEQKTHFSGLKWYRMPVLIIFAKSKIFRLHAILHEVAVSVKSTTQMVPGY